MAPEPIPLAIVYEDDARPRRRQAGRHGRPSRRRPGARARSPRRRSRTRPTIAGVGGPRRPGIVHRLDKDTSGLIVLAKTPARLRRAHGPARRRSVTRRYLAVVHGRRARAGRRRSTRRSGATRARRVHMAVAPAGQGKRAVTRYPGARALRRLHRSSSAASRPAAPTRSGSIWRRSAIRSSATRRMRQARAPCDPDLRPSIGTRRRGAPRRRRSPSSIRRTGEPLRVLRSSSRQDRAAPVSSSQSAGMTDVPGMP